MEQVAAQIQRAQVPTCTVEGPGLRVVAAATAFSLSHRRAKLSLLGMSQSAAAPQQRAQALCPALSWVVLLMPPQMLCTRLLLSSTCAVPPARRTQGAPCPVSSTCRAHGRSKCLDRLALSVIRGANWLAGYTFRLRFGGLRLAPWPWMLHH